jgi:hypothetical protein
MLKGKRPPDKRCFEIELAHAVMGGVGTFIHPDFAAEEAAGDTVVGVGVGAAVGVGVGAAVGAAVGARHVWVAPSFAKDDAVGATHIMRCCPWQVRLDIVIF